MSVIELVAPTGSLDDAFARAAAWLRALGDELDGAAAPSAALWLALGAALCDDRMTANAMLARAEAGAGADRSPGDVLAAALAFALADRRPSAAMRALLLRGAGATPARRSAVGMLLGVGGAAPVRLRSAEAAAVLLGGGPAASVADVADALEAFGADDDALASAAFARGFAELRGHRAFTLGTSLLRGALALRGDAIGAGYVTAYVLGQQRLDGAFGHLPPRAPQVGDIRLAFHLPRTVRSLWTLRDASAGFAIVAREVARAGRAV